MPSALLARHDRQTGLLADLDLDLAGVGNTRPDALLSAWLAPPNEQRNMRDADFRGSHRLCDEGDFTAYRDKAEWPLRGDNAALYTFISFTAAR